MALSFARRAAPSAALCLALGLPGLAAPSRAQTAEGLEVRFELNDAQVKGQVLPGVSVRVKRPGGEEVASGETGADGRFSARLAPGAYEVSYRLPGYVAYTSEATEVRADGQLVTVSLSRMLEATGEVSRDVRIILNWGSREDQVRDADSHLACACADEGRHVHFRNRLHQAFGHKAELDVDDTDWGGPETITLTNPMNGSYLYWVHDYSGPPALMGTSDLVVRVLVGQEQVGEFRVFKGLTRRAWRPFKAIQVRGDAPPSLVRFSEDEIAEGADLVVPPDLQPPDSGAGAPWQGLSCPIGAVLLVGLLILVYKHFFRRR